MQALSGPLQERAEKAVQAGCDIVLHCNGEMESMLEIEEVCMELDESALQQVFAMLNLVPAEHYGASSLEQLEGILSSYFEA